MAQQTVSKRIKRTPEGKQRIVETISGLKRSEKMTRVTQRQETVASWTLAQKQRAGEHWISSRWNAIDPVALNERWLRDCPGGILDSATAPPLSSRGSVKLGCE
ncbi:hypothetical protein DPEC_G00377290, partial [Dallia pectoralis]